MRHIYRHIPNFLTCLNIVCGCYGIVQLQNNELPWASYSIFVALFFDFADGFAARILGAYSEIGKELDSLADMVSFGVLPSLMMYALIRQGDEVWAYTAFILPVFAALRLAKFNIDIRQADSFIGLPTPAVAIFIASLPFIVASYSWAIFLLHPFYLIALVIILSFLMIAELPLFALKFKDFTYQNNRIRYVFLLLSTALLVVFHFLAIPIIIVLYILLSLFFN